MSKCFFCKGNMTPSKTTYAVDLGATVVVVRNVPCEECDICGEKVISDTVMQQLEKILDTAEQTASEIYVTDFQKYTAAADIAA